MSETTRRVVRNFHLRASGYVIGAGLFFATFVLIARYLGTEGFGHFSFILALVGVFQRLADMGVRNILIRDIAVDRGNFRRHLGIARALLWILSLISMGCIVMLAHLLDVTGEVRRSIYLAGLAAIITFQGIGYSAVLRAFEEMGWDILGFTLHKLIFLVLVWGVTRTDWGLQGVSAAMLLANACQWLYLEGLVTSRHGWTRPHLELRAAWALLSEAFPLGIAEMLRRLARHVDKLLLAALSTPTAVGIFSAAYKLLDAVDPFTLTLPLFPVFSRFARDSPGRLFRAYEQSLKFMYVVSIPCAVLLFALAERIMVLCFGNAYGEGAIALQLLAPTVVLLLPKAVYGYVFTALGHQRLYMSCIGIALVVNTVVDLLLIPFYSYVGAAIGTLGGEAVLFLSGLFMLRRLGSSLDSLRSIGRPVLAGLAMGLVCWEVRDRALAPLLLGVLSGLVTYGGLLLILQTFTRQELVLLRESMRVRLGSVTR